MLGRHRHQGLAKVRRYRATLAWTMCSTGRRDRLPAAQRRRLANPKSLGEAFAVGLVAELSRYVRLRRPRFGGPS